MKLLVAELGETLGTRLAVERRGRFRRSDELSAVQVTLGNDVLRAEIDGASVRCTIGHSSGGIRIRSEQVDMATWLEAAPGCIAKGSRESETTRLALESIMIGENP